MLIKRVMGPIHMALRVIVDEPLKRRLKAEAVVRQPRAEMGWRIGQLSARAAQCRGKSVRRGFARGLEVSAFGMHEQQSDDRERTAPAGCG